MRRIARLFWVPIAFLATHAAGAQTVRGIALDASGIALNGVVATLIDSTNGTVARALSNASGHFTLIASKPGTYKIRALRIGFRPTVTPAFQLPLGATVERAVVLNALQVSLDTVHVADRSACRRIADDSSASVFFAWEQVRGALTAAQITAAVKGVLATTIAFDRTLDPVRRRIQKQNTTVHTEFVRDPWRALPVDSLQRAGYVRASEGDSITFYAPGIDMLVSNAFIEDHCFRIARGSDAKKLGLEFEPTSARRKIPEIKGAIWIDRTSSELRRLEFRYTNVPPEQSDDAGGDVEFTRMANGGWVISRWSIRMPVLERVDQQRPFRVGPVDATATRLAELRVAGGTVTTIVAGKDTLWSRPPVTLSGVVIDSVSRNAVPKSRVTLAGGHHEAITDDRGRFTIPSVLPGAYSTEVRTPALDSINAVHTLEIGVADSAASVEIRVPTPQQVQATLCGAKRLDEPGIVTGQVVMAVGDSLPRDARVDATWIVRRMTGTAASPMEVRERRWQQSRVASDGAFRLCGVPVNTELTITASAAGAVSPEPEVVHIPANVRLARADVGLALLAVGKAVFTGTVQVDSTTQPIAQADVTLVDIGVGTRANESGEFRIVDVPAGDHHIVVRRVGYSPVDTVLSFGSGQNVVRRIGLSRATVLDSVRIMAEAMPRAMRTFEDHRHVGLGHFLARAELAKMENQTMGAVLRSLPGMRLMVGISTQLWAASSRNLATERVPDLADQKMGARRACYAVVLLNNSVVYRGRNGDPLFDVNSIRPDQLEAIEYYSSGIEVPIEYGSLEATCGVLVLWTRRTP